MSSVRGKISGLKHLIPFDEAAARMRGAGWRGLEIIEVDVEYSLDMISAEKVKSGTDLPPFHRSAVDGYALSHRDTSGASAERPVSLEVTGDSSSEGKAGSGTCAYISTGGRMPGGADAVIMAEYATVSGGSILVEQPMRMWENVSRRGEDIASGDTIVSRGDVIRPWHIAALIGTGRKRIRVYRRMRIGVMSTGNELLPTSSGAVKNTTQPLIMNYFSNGYISTSNEGVWPDDEEIIADAVKKGMENNDALVITGGSSVGRHDLTHTVLESMGEQVFRGVLMRPGRTISLYSVGGKPVFSVSGLPVAALTSFEMFFEILMEQLTGLKPQFQEVRAQLTDRLTNRGGMRSFVRVIISRRHDSLHASPMRTTGSGMLSLLLESHGVTVIPESVEGMETGEFIWVRLNRGCF